MVDFTSTEGDWNWILLHKIFPYYILDKLQAILPHISSESIPDICLWGGTKTGNLSVSDAYLCNSLADKPLIHWNVVWNLQVSENKNLHLKNLS